jgi:hypothetical protein
LWCRVEGVRFRVSVIGSARGWQFRGVRGGIRGAAGEGMEFRVSGLEHGF